MVNRKVASRRSRASVTAAACGALVLPSHQNRVTSAVTGCRLSRPRTVSLGLGRSGLCASVMV
jgi:hypothetical protein